MQFNSYIVSETKTAFSIPVSNQISNAFTLAETLITLSIIGVVAAMTVPTLMSNVSKQQNYVGLKKAYNQLQNAIKMVPIAAGCSSGDYSCVPCLYYDSSAGVTTNCMDVFTASDTGGFKDISPLAEQFKTTKVFHYGNKDEGCKLVAKIAGHGDSVPCFHTIDGMIYGSSHGLFVDVNGLKGPNKIGQDEFRFFVASETKNGVQAGTVMPYGSRQHSTYMNDDSLYWRNSNSLKQPDKVTDSWELSKLTGKALELGKIE